MDDTLAALTRAAQANLTRSRNLAAELADLRYRHASWTLPTRYSANCAT